MLLDLPNWLGDFVHALPAVEVVLEANRRGETALLVPPGHLPLAQLFPVRVIPRPPRAGPGFARSLRGFDLALTFRHSTRAKLLLRAVPKAEGWASEGRGSRLLGLRTFPVDRSRHQRHDFDHALVRLGLFPVDGKLVRLPLGSPRGNRRSPVALLPGSAGAAAKRYPPSAYREIGRALAAAGHVLEVYVGPSDAALGQWLAREVGGALFPPEAELLEVAKALQGARLVIGNDSGLTHLASALGCPTLALFGPTSPARTAPARGVVLRAPDFFRRGWEGLSPGQVVATAERMLAGGLQEEGFERNICAGGGPLAQLAEQGTLNP